MSGGVENAMEQNKLKVCPLVSNPLQDCYCLDMNSRNIEKVVQFCSGDYERCAIYLENRTKRPNI